MAHNISHTSHPFWPTNPSFSHNSDFTIVLDHRTGDPTWIQSMTWFRQWGCGFLPLHSGDQSSIGLGVIGSWWGIGSIWLWWRQGLTFTTINISSITILTAFLRRVRRVKGTPTCCKLSPALFSAWAADHQGGRAPKSESICVLLWCWCRQRASSVTGRQCQRWIWCFPVGSNGVSDSDNVFELVRMQILVKGCGEFGGSE
jgi:hypothetical protein